MSKVEQSREYSKEALDWAQSQEALPSYKLDAALDKPAVRKRIVEVIAKAMERRPSRRT